MKFEVSALIARVEQKIKDEEAATAKWNASEKAKIAEQRQAWLDKNRDPLVKFADKVKEKLRKDRPLLLSDLPEEFRGYSRADIPLYAEYQPRVRHSNIGELQSLLNALKVVTDTTISPTALRALGFKNLNQYF